MELIGEISLSSETKAYEFTSLVRELAPPGTLSSKQDFGFKMTGVPKNEESYYGVNTTLR